MKATYTFRLDTEHYNALDPDPEIAFPDGMRLVSSEQDPRMGEMAMLLLVEDDYAPDIEQVRTQTEPTYAFGPWPLIAITERRTIRIVDMSWEGGLTRVPRMTEPQNPELIGRPESFVREWLEEHEGDDDARDFLARKGRFAHMDRSTPDREQVYPGPQPPVAEQTHRRRADRDIGYEDGEG